MIDGPSKENLNLTGNILTIEPNSNHYRTGGVGTTSLAAGTAASRIYGPYYVRINHFGMPTVSTSGLGHHSHARRHVQRRLGRRRELY